MPTGAERVSLARGSTRIRTAFASVRDVGSAKRSKRPRRGRSQPEQMRAGHWSLRDAKARFSELVRKVKTDGPQHVCVRGKLEVVVIAADSFHALQTKSTGEALIAAMQASPYHDVDLEAPREPMPVRDVKR